MEDPGRRMFCRAQRFLLALAIMSRVGTPGLQAQELAAATWNRAQVGAIRWDNWRLGSSAAAALDDPASPQRVPVLRDAPRRRRPCVPW